MSVWPDDVVLSGTLVKIEPLSMDHCSDLQESAADGELHKLWYTWIPAPDDVAMEIERRCELRNVGSMQPFAIIDQSSGHAVGMTTFMNIDAQNKRVEIGSTWYRKSVQRSGINTECKLMMLGHAFEVLDCIAVEFRTHVVNLQSRRAIERLGAKPDGILRNHMKVANGTIRDTALYSIINSEWPTVKAHLQWQLAKPRT
ncbi:GCN5 family N-acetyltransferase [Amylibacter ulvae]|uniref:GCN5 family N-acetyltransferase n=1 Tax=Paramylibacter ulvae TaxID=1651968 RepID=A0ABQ3D0Z8_9RHOB|nr:GNAT family protein [Amylibacter ulvae]GHA45935.1 GCN5 family N-acetyltransferase [Amylibacter ulvae]